MTTALPAAATPGQWRGLDIDTYLGEQEGSQSGDFLQNRVLATVSLSLSF